MKKVLAIAIFVYSLHFPKWILLFVCNAINSLGAFFRLAQTRHFFGVRACVHVLAVGRIYLVLLSELFTGFIYFTKNSTQQSAEHHEEKEKKHTGETRWKAIHIHYV